jgi:hypothetical protein
MLKLLTNPPLCFLLCLFVFSIAAWGGAWFHRRTWNNDTESYGDFAFVVGGILTLLALILGFTFSMAVTRYDQRKNFEEQEASSIATAYLRASQLPNTDANTVRKLLRSYIGQRICFYLSEAGTDSNQLERQTNDLQRSLWSASVSAINLSAPPNSVLVLSGMNDVFRSRSQTESSWRNRIPHSALMLVIVIAILSNFLVGYTAHRRGLFLLLVLPLAVSISLFMIVDIDSPRGGYIRVRPQSLESLSDFLSAGN